MYTNVLASLFQEGRGPSAMFILHSSILYLQEFVTIIG